jgi:OmpA-OmpF porin, OOP family
MPQSRQSLLLASALLIAFGVAQPATAQIGSLKKLKDKAKERVDQAANKAMDKALDRVECSVTDQKCINDAQKSGKDVQVVDGSGNVIPGGAAVAQKPGQGAWANYDFVPGERILYADDFMKDNIGDFPRRMEFQTGALEIVEAEGARYLRASQTSRFFVTMPEALPQRYTIEFDYAIPSGEVWIEPGENTQTRVVFTGHSGARVLNLPKKIDANGTYATEPYTDKLRRGRIMVDGDYVKVYVDDKRILNVPNAALPRNSKILFYVDATVEKPALFGNFRVAAGGKKLYDAIVADGRVSTQGIYFDTGSDRIRPESTPTLKEIGAMLTEHADLKLAIEGHTDNVGQAAGNQSLSERRAAAVKAYLVETLQIDAARLEAKGLGATKPVGSNDTPEGRQQNRRVELVRN